MYKRWDIEEEELLELFLSQGMTHPQIAVELNRTSSSIKTKAKRLGIKSKNLVKKTTKQYKAQLPEDLEILEDYVNDSTKILHKHICGHEWLAYPTHVLKGHSCPPCNRGGYVLDNFTPAQLYVIDFGNDLYKIGISNNYKKRIAGFTIPCEVVYIREFETGKEAMEIEKQYLSNVKPYLYNTGKLRSGNTETFKYEE